MKLTNKKIQNLIKEEFKILIKENFDEDTGMPISARGMQIAMKDSDMMKKRIYPPMQSLLNEIGEEYGLPIQKIMMAGIQTSKNPAEVLFQLLKIAQERGYGPTSEEPQEKSVSDQEKWKEMEDMIPLLQIQLKRTTDPKEKEKLLQKINFIKKSMETK